MELGCRTITDTNGFAGLTDAWSRLAQSAVESNPFYGPSFLLPLLEECGWPAGLEIWLIAPRSDPSQIVGLFPFHRRRFGPGNALHVIAPFTRGRHGAREIDIDLGLPLIDGACVDAVLDALLNH